MGSSYHQQRVRTSSLPYGDQRVWCPESTQKILGTFQRRMRWTFTHNFEFGQVVLSFAPVPFKTGTHVHTRPDHCDSIFQSFWNERVIHGAFCNRLLPLYFAGFGKLLDE